jgi:hypothetical protein
MTIDRRAMRNEFGFELEPREVYEDRLEELPDRLERD